MSPKLLKPKKPKKLSNILAAWIVLGTSLLGIGIVLFKSKPTSIRYMAIAKPFVLPPIGVEEATEEAEPEIKEEELIQLTQLKPLTPEPTPIQ